MIPIVDGSLGTVPKSIKKKLRELEINEGWIDTNQITVLHKNIYKRSEDTHCH